MNHAFELQGESARENDVADLCDKSARENFASGCGDEKEAK